MGILQNIRDIVKNLKHDHPKPKLCPRCGSPKLKLSSRFDIWLFPEQYVCEQCGYKGPITMELEEIDEAESSQPSPQSGSSKLS